VGAALVPLGISGTDRRARAAKSLADVGLGDRARHLPSELSGGQQQRVAIARALVKEPKVLLADEPTGNLDEGHASVILAELRRLCRDRGASVLLVTHRADAAALADRTLRLRAGRLESGGGHPR